MRRKFGGHLSIADGYEALINRALRDEMEAFQIFTANPRSMVSQKVIDEDSATLFKNLLTKHSLGPVVVHSNYLLNLASSDDEKYGLSIESLMGELVRADALGASFLVLHPGHAHKLSMDDACKRIAYGLDCAIAEVNPKVTICLENMAGMGSEVGSKYHELSQIIGNSKYANNIGVCFDTCHAYSAGYNLSTIDGLDSMFSEIEDTIGASSIKVVHINDSIWKLGLKKDRHTNIGKGNIGIEAFKRIINRKEILDCPFILETPDKEDNARMQDIQLLRSLVEE